MAKIEGEVHHNFTIDDEAYAVFVVTKHAGAVAMTAIHTADFDHSIGGVRFVKEASISEVGHLSKAMTEKCMAANIPAGGQKSVIVADAALLNSDEHKLQILRDHIGFVIQNVKSAIFGPDMNVPENLLDILAEDTRYRRHLTGLSERQNGLSIDRNGYTAFGIVEAVRIWGERDLKHLTKATVQGFGAVGAHTAQLLNQMGIQIIGISTSLGAIVARRSKSLDMGLFFSAWRDGGDAAVMRLAAQRSDDVEIQRNPTALFQEPTQIFVPSARTSCFGIAQELEGLRIENVDVCDVSVLTDVGAVQLVVQGANHPLSYAAEEYLESKGVAVLIDVIINCGGLIGCWLEWLCRRENRSATSDLAKQARTQIRETIRSNMSEARTPGESSRSVARRIADRNRLRLQQIKR